MRLVHRNQRQPLPAAQGGRAGGHGGRGRRLGAACRRAASGGNQPARASAAELNPWPTGMHQSIAQWVRRGSPHRPTHRGALQGAQAVQRHRRHLRRDVHKLVPACGWAGNAGGREGEAGRQAGWLQTGRQAGLCSGEAAVRQTAGGQQGQAPSPFSRRKAARSGRACTAARAAGRNEGLGNTLTPPRVILDLLAQLGAAQEAGGDALGIQGHHLGGGGDSEQGRQDRTGRTGRSWPARHVAAAACMPATAGVHARRPCPRQAPGTPIHPPSLGCSAQLPSPRHTRPPGPPSAR